MKDEAEKTSGCTVSGAFFLFSSLCSPLLSFQQKALLFQISAFSFNFIHSLLATFSFLVLFVFLFPLPASQQAAFAAVDLSDSLSNSKTGGLFFACIVVPLFASLPHPFHSVCVDFCVTHTHSLCSWKDFPQGSALNLSSDATLSLRSRVSSLVC